MVLFGITRGKGSGRINNYYQRRWHYPPPNTTFFISKHYETFIQTLRTITSDEYVGAHPLSSSRLDQITNHNGNTDVNNNDDLQSFEKSRENSCSSSCFW